MGAAERHEALRVTLVATVLNEYGSVPGWFEGLRQQRRLPDECIIVDGGSTDGTLELLSAADMPFLFKVVELPGANISAGRNAAIARATGDVIVVTDAGTEAEPDWLQRLVAPLEANPDVDIAAGFFEASGTSLWSRTLAAATLPDVREIKPERFLASSRSVAIRGRWFDYGFEYPEWLDYCEDVVLDSQLRRAGAAQAFVPDARVRFEPRRGPAAFFRQYYRYARGDGKAGLFARRHLIRYLTYIGAIFVLTRRRPSEAVVAGLLGALYLLPNVRRYRAWNRESVGARFIVAVPLMAAQKLLGDVAKMCGYPVGLRSRVKRDGSWKLWRSTWANRRPDGDLRRP